jgi:hypothetical protein
MRMFTHAELEHEVCEPRQGIATPAISAVRACATLLHDRRGAMTVLLAYIHTPDGDAALAAVVDEARWRATKAVVVNVTRPVAEVDSPMSAEQTLDAVAAPLQGG